jgi:AcrR family transcriptional regulator
MTTTASATKSSRSSNGTPGDTPRWEERSQNRVLEVGRDQLLERSRRIVEAAYELLDSAGLEGLTIRAVLEKTGLSRRAFYERFAGKDDLMLAVFEQTIRLAAGHYREQVRALADPMARLNLIIVCIVLGQRNLEDAGRGHSNRRGAAMSREHLRLAESCPDELQAALNPLITLIAEQLASGMEAGLVRNVAPQRLATLLYNLVSTTVHTELLAHEGSRPDRARQTELARDIWEFCRRAIAAA